MASSSVKGLRIALWGLVAVAAALVLWFAVVAPRLNEAVADDFGRGDYRLTATDGTEFTEATLREGPSAVFFGFVHCPDVCPTTLGDIAAWQQELGADAEDLRVYFVTVDPERDTAEILGDYVSWVPGVVGVTGSRAEMDKALAAFRVYARQVPLTAGDYTMDHSSYVMLFDDRGRFFEPIGYQEDFERAVAKLRRMLGA